MNPARWEQMQTVFHEAVTLSESEQLAFLAAACNGDVDMLTDLRRMLEENNRGDSILDRGLPDVAQRLIGSGVASLLGREIGAYRLVKLIGEGGMGVVYLAERTDTGKQVAMKFLPGASMSPARRALFTHEIKTHAKLSHACIAAQYDAGTLPDGTPWFVMEYVHGKHFLEYCQTRQSSLEARLKLFVQVCQALEYLHGKGIIHRDLKPSNILVDETGTPRVLDFGISEEAGTLKTSSGLRLMTRAYAAPELLGQGIVDNSTDVYSLGVIFREMLTSDVTGARKTARRELDKIARRALQADPNERYRSVEALRRDVEHFLKTEPLEGTQATRWYRTERFVTRHRTAVIAASLAILLFVGMAGFFTFRLAQERNVALAEVKRTRLVEQFLFNLFQGGDKYAGPASDVRVLTLLDRGEKETKAFDHEPQLQAELYQVLGGIYQELAQFDHADTLLQASLKEKYAAQASADEIAENLLALSSLRLDQGKLPDAERIARKALDIRKAQSPPDAVAVARAQSLLGRILIERGQYEKALVLLKQAQQTQAGHEDAQADLAATLVGFSDAYFYLSRYPLAEDWQQKALSLHEKVDGGSHPLVAFDLRNLGNIQFQTSHYVEAEKYFRQALKIEQAWYGEGHPATADMQVYVAQALGWQGRLPEAHALLANLLPAMERAYGEMNPHVALVLNELGSEELYTKNLLQAEAHYLQAVNIYRQTLGDENQETTVARNNLASVYLKLAQYPRAEKIFSDVLQILVKDNLARTFNAGVTRIKLGRALTREGRYREAEAQLHEGCDILRQMAGPNAEWIVSVRPDLATIYQAIGQPAKPACR